MKRFRIATLAVVCFVSGLLVYALLLDVGNPSGFSLHRGKPARYIFLFIGDGMGQAQRTAAQLYFTARDGKKVGEFELTMNGLPAQGSMTVHSADAIIPDSADTATAMACGVKTNRGMLGMSPDGTKLRSIARLAKEKGMRVGILSTVSLDHATPAAFYAQQPTRKNYHEISYELVLSGFDFFAGGGFTDPTGKKAPVSRGNVLEFARDQGYRVITDNEDFLSLGRDAGKTIFVHERLTEGQSMPYRIDRADGDLHLADLVAKAIELLSGPKGFFLMAEQGKIDWACHANDARTLFDEMLDLDEAVKKAVEFYEKHPGETLIVVTGDHECGGLSIGSARTGDTMNLEVLPAQKMSHVRFHKEVLEGFRKGCGENCRFEDLKPLITDNFGLKFSEEEEGPLALSDEERRDLQETFEAGMGRRQFALDSSARHRVYGRQDPLTVTLTRTLNTKAGLGWTSFSHTGIPVPVSALGVGSETFNGSYDNTEVALKLKAAMGLPAVVHAVQK